MRSGAKERQIEKAAIRFISPLYVFMQNYQTEKNRRETFRRVIRQDFAKFTYTEMVDVFWLAYRQIPKYHQNFTTGDFSDDDLNKLIAGVLAK